MMTGYVQSYFVLFVLILHQSDYIGNAIAPTVLANHYGVDVVVAVLDLLIE